MEYKIELLEPAVEFITEQPVKMKAKILRTINLLEEFGPNLSEPHVKKITDAKELYELRVKQGSNICRLFFFHHLGKIYVITSGYVKKENKLNTREIKKAMSLMNNFKREVMEG